MADESSRLGSTNVDQVVRRIMSTALAEPPVRRNTMKSSRPRRAAKAASRKSRNLPRPRKTLCSSQLLPKLIEDHQAEVWRYLRALGCPADMVEDLAQETFLVAFCRPFEYRGPAAAAAYLRRTAYHRFVSHLQKHKSLVELKDVEVANATWERWCSGQRDNSEIFEILAECMSSLPERSRYALELRYRDGLSRQEIAKELSLSEHGAKNLIQRAKQRLRESLETRTGARQTP